MLNKLLPPARVPTPISGFQQIIHGGDYNPDQWLSTVPTILEEDARLMRLAGINSSSVGIFSWTALEPSEGQFRFDWLDRVMHEQARIGNKVVLATPSGAMPAWLAEKYPEARRVDRRGHRAHYGARHNHCWSSPAYHERVADINSRLATRYKGHPALAMWHVSNELNGDCYCDLCRARWAQWLEARYHTLDKLIDAHWATFWSHQPTKWQHVEPTDWVVDGMMFDWLRFNVDQLIKWYRFEADGLKRITPEVPVTTNFMTTTYSIDYQRISREVDVVADDQYPRFDPDAPDFLRQGIFWSMKNDLYRCMKPERSFFLMESCPGAIQWQTPQKLRRPGVLKLEMFQALAAGADGTSYFQFRAGRGAHEKLHGAVVEQVIPAGDIAAAEKMALKTRRFSEVKALSAAYDKMTGVLGTSVRPEVAIVYDWESKWGQKLSAGTGVDEYRYNEVAAEQYAPFWKAGIPVDVISPDRDLSKYKLVILPQFWVITPLMALKLRKYVEDGGTLVATYDTGMADEHNRLHLGGTPGCGLHEVFGLWVEETDRLPADAARPLTATPGNELHLPHDLAGREVAAIAHLAGATALATFASDFYAYRPAVTTHLFGKGRTYFVATRLDEAGNAALYGAITSRLHLHRAIDAALPAGVTAQLRGVATGAGTEAFVFLLNFSKDQKTVPLGTRVLTDLETGQTYRDTVPLEALGARVYRIE